MRAMERASCAPRRIALITRSDCDMGLGPGLRRFRPLIPAGSVLRRGHLDAGE